MFTCEPMVGVFRKILARRPSFHWAFIEIPFQMLCFGVGGLIQYIEHKSLLWHLVYFTVLIVNIRCLGVGVRWRGHSLCEHIPSPQPVVSAPPRGRAVMLLAVR